MASCAHKTLDFVGEQRTDDGVNAYYTCKDCGDMVIITPSRKVIGLKGVQGSGPAPSVGLPARS